MSFKKHGYSIDTRLGSLRVTEEITSNVVLEFYEALDCPRSLTAALLYRYGEHDQLAELEFNPQSYLTGKEFRDAYLATSYLSKSKFLKTSFDKKRRAIDKFEKFELLCKRTNFRFRHPLTDPVRTGQFDTLLSAMCRKIEDILGEFNSVEFFKDASWGPGVSTLVKGEHTSACHKFQHETGITRDLYPLVKDLFPLTYPGWWNELLNKQNFPQFQVGNVVITVPKTSKIDRVIAVEPGINLWLQLSLKSMIRRRMARAGINLNTQKTNQLAAEKSSLDDSLATVDFSSASDSISSELVRVLFSGPNSSRWFEVMDITRSQYGSIDGSVRRWEKFSSMGNGFTWDLESLIFYSAAFVCTRYMHYSTSEICVFGDDVILPKHVYELFSKFSEFLGFQVNLDKSFDHGYFRESCGAHFYRGIDCKPVYLVDRLTSFQHVFNLANLVRLRSHCIFYCDVRFRPMFYGLQKLVPKKFRYKVPATFINDELGPLDGGFISNFDEACPRLSRDRKGNDFYEGYLVDRLSWVGITNEVEYPGLLLARLRYKSVDEARKNNYELRGRTKCVKTRTSVRQWYDLGPWL